MLFSLVLVMLLFRQIVQHAPLPDFPHSGFAEPNLSTCRNVSRMHTFPFAFCIPNIKLDLGLCVCLAVQNAAAQLQACDPSFMALLYESAYNFEV
jgi:hypothetical protein